MGPVESFCKGMQERRLMVDGKVYDCLCHNASTRTARVNDLLRSRVISTCDWFTKKRKNAKSAPVDDRVKNAQACTVH
jgi:molybdenum cofactor biosynthesis enzyme MoaA